MVSARSWRELMQEARFLSSDCLWLQTVWKRGKHFQSGVGVKTPFSSRKAFSSVVCSFFNEETTLQFWYNEPLHIPSATTTSSKATDWFSNTVQRFPCDFVILWVQLPCKLGLFLLFLFKKIYRCWQPQTRSDGKFLFKVTNQLSHLSISTQNVVLFW